MFILVLYHQQTDKHPHFGIKKLKLLDLLIYQISINNEHLNLWDLYEKNAL